MANKDNRVMMDKDMVCPECLEILPGCSVLPARLDRYGRELRTYFGWCCECHGGYEVIQFRRCDRWHINRYRYWLQITDQTDQYQTDGWILISDLPDPPIAVTGPGGDYDRPVEVSVSDTVIRAAAVLRSAAQTLAELAKTLVANRPGQKTDER